MCKVLMILALLVLFVLFTGPTNAEEVLWNAQIPSSYLWDDGGTPTATANTPIIIEIEVGNNSSTAVHIFTAPWHVYGLDDVHTVDWIDAGGTEGEVSVVLTNGFQGSSIWEVSNSISTWSWDGVLPDTLSHRAISIFGPGWPAYSPMETHYEFHLSIPLNPGEQGEICIDSINLEIYNFDWQFDRPSNFMGPYCWPVAVPPNLPPDIIGTPANLTLEHHENFDVTYVISDPESDPITGVGAIDDYGNPLGTATYVNNGGVYSIIWDYDPHCNRVGQANRVRLYAEDVSNSYPGSVNLYEIHLNILNSAPVISGDCGKTLDVQVNTTGTASFTATDPNIGSPEEILLFTIESAIPYPNGTANIDPNTGDFVFDPTTPDVNQTFIFTIRVTDCAGEYDECDVTFALAPAIVSVSPTQNELNVPANTNISVTFDADMDPASISNTSFIVTSELTGLSQGIYSYDIPSRTVTFNPDNDFKPGDVVTMTLTTGIESSTGVPLVNSSISSFTTISGGAPGDFVSSFNFLYSEWYCMPGRISASDMDADGDLDLVLSNLCGGLIERDLVTKYFRGSVAISIHMNNGDATFDSYELYDIPDIQSIVTCDLDNDGDLDIAVGGHKNLYIYLNAGDGTLSQHASYSIGSSFSSFCGIIEADYDGDGDFDLALVNHTYNYILVLLNNGDGTFPAGSSFITGGSPASIYAADLDNDFDIDLVTSSMFGNNISVLLNNGDGTFASHVTYSTGTYPSSIYAADFDGDGDVDIATGNGVSIDVSILLNSGNGTFSSFVAYPVDVMPWSIHGADIDSDNDIDIIISGESAISIIANDGNGIFGQAELINTYSFTGYTFPADLDGDGDLDIATSALEILSNMFYLCGDVNNDELINILDIVYLINYKYKEGPNPISMSSADVNSDELINILDIVYLINYKYKEGPEPACP